VYRDNFTLLFVLRFVSTVLHVPSFDGSVRVVTSVDRTDTHKMLVVLLSLRKLGNLWKDSFDCSVVYVVKGTSNSSGCVSTRPTECFNPLKPELNPICYLLALLGAHHFLHVSRIRVKLLTFRLLMSSIYMEHPFLMFLDHTQRRSTVGRTPLDE